MIDSVRFLHAHEYGKILVELRKVVDINMRLPQQVFARNFDSYAFVDFYALMAEPFWRLARLACSSGGCEFITFFVLDPDPVGYYNREFGYCNVLRIASASSERALTNALLLQPPNSPADAIAYNSDVICILPDNKMWVAWGERDTGIGVVAAQGELLGKIVDCSYQIGLEDASEIFYDNHPAFEGGTSRIHSLLSIAYARRNPLA